MFQILLFVEFRLFIGYNFDRGFGTLLAVVKRDRETQADCYGCRGTIRGEADEERRGK